MKIKAVKCTVKLSRVMCRENRWAWYWDEQGTTCKNIHKYADPPKED